MDIHLTSVVGVVLGQMYSYRETLIADSKQILSHVPPPRFLSTGELGLLS